MMVSSVRGTPLQKKYSSLWYNVNLLKALEELEMNLEWLSEDTEVAWHSLLDSIRKDLGAIKADAKQYGEATAEERAAVKQLEESHTSNYLPCLGMKRTH